MNELGMNSMEWEKIPFPQALGIISCPREMWNAFPRTAIYGIVSLPRENLGTSSHARESQRN